MSDLKLTAVRIKDDPDIGANGMILVYVRDEVVGCLVAESDADTVAALINNAEEMADLCSKAHEYLCFDRDTEVIPDEDAEGVALVDEMGTLLAELEPKPEDVPN